MEPFEKVKALFKGCDDPEARYKKIIELGGKLPPMPPNEKVQENIVPGCQSLVYLSAEYVDEKIYFTAYSDALISAGLASLLIEAYSGQSPEFIVKNHPTFLEELGITASLTPGRSNGLASMYRSMQKHALNFLIPG